ncbi:MAG: lysophospholipid acyltransferase family protein [Desulfuromonadales bacterium]
MKGEEKKNIREWALFRLVPFVASWIIRFLRRTIRAEFVGEEIPAAFWKRGEPVILAFWHDQLLLMVKGYRGPGARILISASKDGEIIARTMEQFGQGAVRGSSSRGGKAAFREMVELGRQPFDLVFTPDGPKGPRHEVKMGVVQLARLTGRPVIPMAFVCSRGHRFSSWDRFLLPFPFSRAVYCFGPALEHSKTESGEEFRSRLQSAMEDNVEKARKRLEDRGVSAV